MDFGKLDDLSGVDFSLPPPDDRNAALFATLPPRPQQPALYTGATGWTTKAWIGHFYPVSAASHTLLRHYSHLFNAIELNTTHYQIPTEATIADWYQKTETGFKFSPKIPQLISHSRNLNSPSTWAVCQQFAQAVSGLKDKLGVCFLQLPPTFSPDRLDELQCFIEKFASLFVPFALEVRHKDWFAKATIKNRLFDILQANGVGTVITDVAGRRDVLHLRLTAPFTLVRFVGNGLHSTDYTRLRQWIAQIHQWMQQPLEAIYFFLHQPDNVLVPQAMQFLSQTAKEWNMHIRYPQQILPTQTTLF